MTTIRKTFAATLTAAILSSAALMGSVQTASAGYYGYNSGYSQYHYTPTCFYKKVKVWGYYGYQWKRVRVCH
jgi:hypothetical protein